jgi:p-cumate 2,3-dioxygenase subunit beta
MTQLSARLVLRLEVEDFLYREAALLDAWSLKEWLGLFADDARYEIAPTGDPEAGSLDAAETLFLVADDRVRLEQRIIRLQKPSAHAEYPHSRVRHIYSNIRAEQAADGLVDATANFVTFRTKRNITATYMGMQVYRLARSDDGFRIRLKRNVLDLDSLVPQGKVSLIL